MPLKARNRYDFGKSGKDLQNLWIFSAFPVFS